MSQNPYAPPAATVADLDDRTVSLDRPRNVVLAVRLLWTEVAIGIPGLVYEAFNPPGDDSDPSLYWTHLAGLAVTVGFLALSVIINWKIWQGRNWARIVGLVLLIVGLLMSVIGYATSYFVSNEVPDLGTPLFAAVYLLQTLLDIVAIWLLFTASANAWYRAMKSARR